MSDLFTPYPVIADYFGKVLELYQGMIKTKGINNDRVEKAFWDNEVDNCLMIHIGFMVHQVVMKCFVRKILE